MIEAIGIPLILKAVDFLFGEGSKILAERRERRKEQKTAAENRQGNQGDSILDLRTPDIIASKETALAQQVQESAWLAEKYEVEHLLRLSDIWKQNYYLAREQSAQWGSSLVPPIIVHNLDEAEDNIAKTMLRLQRPLLAACLGRNSSPLSWHKRPINLAVLCRPNIFWMISLRASGRLREGQYYEDCGRNQETSEISEAKGTTKGK
jgi:hypothetical protein